MNFRKGAIRGMVWLAGGILALLVPLTSAVHAEEDVRIIERKPDESNPLYEIVEVEGGVFFQVPKDMPFVKKNGLISPLSTEEYCVNKFEKIARQIEALNDRIAALEKVSGSASDMKKERSL